MIKYDKGQLSYCIRIKGNDVETKCRACFDAYKEAEQPEPFVPNLPYCLPDGTAAVVEVLRASRGFRKGSIQIDYVIPYFRDVVGFREWLNDREAILALVKALGMSKVASVEQLEGGRARAKLGVREDKFGILGRCNKISQWLSRSIRSNTCEHGFTYYSIEDRLLF